MKKYIAILLALVMCFSLVACGKDKAETPVVEETPIVDETPIVEEEPEVEPVGMPNPVSVKTEEEMIELGYSFKTIEGMSDIEYVYYDIDTPIAEMRFNLNGVAYNYRMSPVNELTDFSGVFANFDEAKSVTVGYLEAQLLEEVIETVENGTEVAEEVVVEEVVENTEEPTVETTTEAEVKETPVENAVETVEEVVEENNEVTDVNFAEAHDIVIYWYDVVPGMGYTLHSENGTVEETLAVANSIFEPLQGEVDGDTTDVDGAAVEETVEETVEPTEEVKVEETTEPKVAE